MHRLTRAIFAAIALAAIHTSLLSSQAALGQERPDRPITLIAPYGVGTGTDSTARLVAEKMSEALKQRIIVENRAGASGMIGAEFVARRPPDGLTLLVGTNQIFATNPHYFKEIRYDPIKDFTPIALLVLQESLLVVNSSVPAKTVPELVAYAKANPHKLTFGSAGLGTTGHLAGELLKTAANIEMTHVPYTSGQLFTDLLSGVVSVAFYPYATLKPHIDSGAVRVLASTGTSRSPWLPNVSTMIELGYPKIVFTSWTALYGPKGIAPKVVDELSAAAKFALSSPDIKQKLEATSARLEYMNSEQLGAFTASELTRVGGILREAGVEKQ